MYTDSTYHRVSFFDVQYIPEVNEHRNPNSEDRQNAINFGSPSASHEYTSQG